MLHRFYRKLFIGFVSLCLVTATLFLTLPHSLRYLAKPIAQYFASPYGLKVQLLDIEDINIHRWNHVTAIINTASITYDDTLRFDTEEIKAEWRNGKYNIALNKLLVLDKSDDLESIDREQKSQVNLIDYLPETWLPNTPEFTLAIAQVEIIPHRVSGSNLDATLSQETLQLNTIISIAKDSPTIPILEDGNALPIHVSLDSSSLQINAEGSKTKIRHQIDFEKTTESELVLHGSTKFDIPLLELKRENENDITISNLKLNTKTHLTTPTTQVLNLAELTNIKIAAEANAEFLVNSSTTIKADTKHELKMHQGNFRLQADAQNSPLININDPLLSMLSNTINDTKKESGAKKNKGETVRPSISLNQNKSLLISGTFNQDNRLSYLAAELLNPEISNEKAPNEASFTLLYQDAFTKLAAEIEPILSDDISKQIKSFALNFSLSGNPKTFLDQFTPKNKSTLTFEHPYIDIHTQLVFDFPQKSLAVNFNKKSVVKLGKLQLDTLSVSKPTLTLPKQRITFNLAKTEKTPIISPVKISIAAEKVISGDNTIPSPAAEVLFSNNENLASFALTTSALDIKNTVENKEAAGANKRFSNKSTYIPPITVASKIEHTNSVPTKANFTISNICKEPIINVVWQPILKKEEITGHYLKANWERSFTEAKTLHKWLNTSMPPINLTKGEIKGNVAFKIERDVNIDNVNLTLTNANGISSLGTFTGVQLRLSSVQAKSNTNKLRANGTETTDTRKVTSPAQNTKHHMAINAEIKSLETGVTVEKIKLAADVFQHEAMWHSVINEATSSVFGGTAFIEPQSIKIDDDISVNLMLENLNLAELVRTQQMKDLKTSGKISGFIPIHYHNGELIIDDGQLKSVEQGKIQYNGPLSNSADLNEQLKYTLNILKDFQYTELTSNVTYDKNALKLSSHISGRNPKVENGRPVNFNLNTEIGLGGAFEIMRLQAGIESKLEEFVNKKMNPSSNKYFCEQ